MKRKTIATSLLIPLLTLVAGSVPALPAKAAPLSTTDADTQAMVQEERDRLAREKREMLAREALLLKQLKTHQQLLESLDAQLEELKRQVRELNNGD